jgi:transcription-repair coupling factor (superfamily II helicase)
VKSESNLYQQMLEDAVADIRAGEGRRTGQERDWTPNISFGLPVLIPEDYVRDLPVRLGLYRRIGALASDAETEAMAAELVDRFGTCRRKSTTCWASWR